MTSKSPRERDIGYSQEKPAHPPAAVQTEAIKNNVEHSANREIQRRHQGEVTRETIERELAKR